MTFKMYTEKNKPAQTIRIFWLEQMNGALYDLGFRNVYVEQEFEEFFRVKKSTTGQIVATLIKISNA